MQPERSPDDILAEVEIERASLVCSFLIVEGPDDDRFWSHRRHLPACSTVIGWGRDNVVGGVRLINGRGISGVFAIVDRDWDGLGTPPPPVSNLSMTDTHDLETMLLRSCLDKVLGERGSPDKIQRFEQRNRTTVEDALLARTASAGRLRWVSRRNDLKLKLRKLGKDGWNYVSYGKFIDRNWNLDEADMVKTVLDFNQRPDLKVADLLAEMRALPAVADPWQLCNGHDMAWILALGLRSVLGSATVTGPSIESDLRLAYERAHFEMTQLFGSIRAWESSSNPFRILCW